MPLRVAVITVGCRANQADSAWLARRLDPRQVRVVAPDEPAEVYLVNSCAVTRAAVRDARKAINRARRRAGAGARILLTGCLVTADTDAVAELGPLWQVVPATERERIPSLIASLAEESSPRSSSSFPRHREPSRSDPDFDFDSGSADALSFGGSEPDVYPLPEALYRTRPSLRIQDGCEQRCAYCAVPAGRGPERSLELGEVFRRLEVLAAEGAREVVICGVNLGRWGRDLRPKRRLSDLIRLLDREAPVDRVRLSSIEPWAVDPAAIEAFGEAKRLAPHLHLPLQSGDDEVLGRMGRPYRAQRFRELVGDLLAVRPELCLGTDIMAGFPGEGAAAFERTLELLRELPLAYLHAFGFSARPGTRAFGLGGRAPSHEIKERVRQLRALGQEKRRRFLRGLVGQVVHPVIESREPATGQVRGVAGRFVTVSCPGPEDLPGELVAVRAEGLDERGRLVGRLLP